MRQFWENKRKYRRMIRWIKEWLRDIVPALLLAYLLFGILFRLTVVVGNSMEPTLRSGSLIVTQHAFYRPKRGDIVVCRPEPYGKTLIKRVIGIAGDTVDIDFQTGEVMLNGTVLEEPYIMDKTHRNADGMRFPITVESGMVFLLGDNRNNSMDSRSAAIGQVPEEDILSGYLFMLIP